ncbi:MAG: hypothetical protein ABJP34_04375 [Erythrobacter sp.]
MMMEKRLKRAIEQTKVIQHFEAQGFLSTGNAQKKSDAVRRLNEQAESIANEFFEEYGNVDSAKIALAQQFTEFEQAIRPNLDCSDEDWSRVRAEIEFELDHLSNASGAVQLVRSRKFKWMLLPFGLIALWFNLHIAVGDPIPPVPVLSELFGPNLGG